MDPYGPQGHCGQGRIFIKRTTIHCYKQNMKALGLVVSEGEDFFKVLPMTPPPGQEPV